MRVRFQYTDWTEWEGPPEDAHLSPDKGVVSMFAFDDFDNCVTFTYQDFYYLYRDYNAWGEPMPDGGWLFGAASERREFILRPGQRGCSGDEVPFKLPRRAVVRKGETVSQGEAVKFGLIKSVDEKELHPKRDVPIKRGCCG